MIFGFFTDLHAKADSPGSRIDDYRKSILLKLEEMGEIWNKYDVDVVLFGGDLFHTADPVTSIQYDVMHELRKWNKPIYSIIGSHDYFGYQIKTMKRTALGLFHKAGVVQVLGLDSPSITFKNSTFRQICITATNHSYWLCDDTTNLDQKKLNPEDFQIQLVHTDLLDKPVIWKHILCKDVHTESDIILSGHYHPGWKGVVEGNGTLMVNPGSIGRTENSKIIRIPQVCILTITDICTIDFVKLTNVIENPFRETIVIKEEEQDITKLLSLVKSVEVTAVDIKKALPALAEKLNISNRVKVLDKSFELLERAHL